VPEAIEKIIDTYLKLRSDSDETFLEAYRRLGAQPFKDVLYGAA
jgi:sulfite reductase (NADPH) hemoprotein beta-component